MLRAFVTILFLLVLGTATLGGGVVWALHTYGRDLPDYRQLADYKPSVMTRVHAGDGQLLTEFAVEKRVFVPLEAIPRHVVAAFLSAEDKTFYSHPGIDVLGVIRAALLNIKNIGSGRRPVGASTITQQVAKNFLLTNEVSIARKVKEAILSFRIERAFPKDLILELYLNEIYLGYGSYGVAAAALNYFNKSLVELNIPEAAFLAALPKAPNNYNPVTKPKAAKGRRNWVIGRMLDDGQISAELAERSRNWPLITTKRKEISFVEAAYFAEEVRRDLVERYGENELYKGGLSVRTTVDPRLQAAAVKALRGGLEAYDRRHGYAGPLATAPEGERFDVATQWRAFLATIKAPKGIGNRVLAVVLGADDKVAEIGLADGSKATIPLAELKWARQKLEDRKRGPSIKKASDALKPGDVVITAPVLKTAKGEPYPEGTHGLYQIPEIEGGIVAMDPHTGRVLAMVGGYDYEKSQFNRATQAKRQPGSAFKPFVYLAAMDAGYTPATLILDAPFVIDQGPGLPKWRPANYTKKFYGPSTMRLGVEKSRNLMTVRLAQTIGMDKVAAYAERFGIVDNMQETLSMALGAGETTLLRLTAAYAMLVNGGKRIIPTFIDRIQDRKGKTVFRHDNRACPDCRVRRWKRQPVPEVPDNREQVTAPGSAYQIVNILTGVVKRGTGRRVRAVGKPLAGKTGTTNEERDTWFMGFSPDLAVGVFAGLDEPKPLGRRETGSSVAAPVFRDFMIEALKNAPSIPFRIPPGIRLVRVDSKTGRLAEPGAKGIILEAFKPGTIPTGESTVIEGQSWSPEGGIAGGGTPTTGTGGLY